MHSADGRAVIANPAIDIVVELIGGIEPAKGFILEAIANGKHVVMVNVEADALAFDSGATARIRAAAQRTRNERHLARAERSELSGNQILEYGNAAPDWAKDVHGPTAGALAGVFAVNTITGAWNLWEGRKDPNHRAKRMTHGILMIAADIGFLDGRRLQADHRRVQHVHLRKDGRAEFLERAAAQPQAVDVRGRGHGQAGFQPRAQLRRSSSASMKSGQKTSRRSSASPLADRAPAPPCRGRAS